MIRGFLLLLLLAHPVYGQAVWGNRTYSAPICNSPYCTMCNAIRTQLAKPSIVQALRHVTISPPRLAVTTLEPSPQEAVDALISLINPTPRDVVYDLGSGDGRVLTTAALKGARAVGIELNPDSVEISEGRARILGVADRIKVYHGDILDYDLGDVRIATMFLFPELMTEVIKKLPSGCRVYSYIHPLPTGAIKHEFGTHVYWEWLKP